MNKQLTMEQAMEKIHNGMTLMLGGFMAVGTPEIFIDAILDKGIRDLTVICNDTGFVDKGLGRLVVEKRLRKVIASHIGTNPETGRLMNTGELEVELIPQGTLAERIRCGGYGLGGVLTPTGLGTLVEKGKQVIHANGKDYLLELPLRADVALIRGSIVDKMGNTFYNASTRNFNPLMAMAADTVIVGAQKLVEIGALDPNHVMTPGILVDYIVEGERS
ncbi:acetate CoA-transferase subunit alpha [Alkalibacter rhizosphaerae]|uniref:Acetate CoA-transferase subunit alpha n=1 Tax=Alkalibacter rhizosphaerae TaxID=2815577 RepID=A0A974XGT3_9FIRM|nr:acetate CoA-transferase subunit alpha [Alkalibacter rhizosphaerae]QSX08043.1 acetate CoA-transferase subunit alpha [Alkalibacter rhizosphaerae]